MPAEVISLLSSPVIAAASRATEAPPPAPAPPQKSVKQSLSSDFLDLDDDLLEIIGASEARTNQNPSTTRLSPRRNAPQPPRKREVERLTAPIPDDEVWMFSDNFEPATTAIRGVTKDVLESDDLPDFLSGPTSKRPRLATTTTNGNSSRAISTGLPRCSRSPGTVGVAPRSGPCNNTSGLKLLNSAPEQIEVSYSPQVNKNRAVSKLLFDLDFDDDPFASSSPRNNKENQPWTGSGAASTRHVMEEDDGGGLFVSSQPAEPPKPRSRPQKQTAAAWDPIISSSAAPLPVHDDDDDDIFTNVPRRALQKSRSEVITLDDSDDDAGRHPFSDGSDEFPDIADIDLSKPRHPPPPFSRRLPIILPSRSTSPEKRPVERQKKPAARKKSAEEREQEKHEKAAAREAEKERKKLEKERERQQKAQAKEQAAALAEVNKIRTDKKVSTPEMIVDLPDTLQDTTKLQAETLLRDLDVQSNTWKSPVPNVVKWRRKVKCRYNNDLGRWEPIPLRIEPEPTVMVLVTAEEFVSLARPADLGEMSLDAHVARMKRNFPDNTIIYLIEGLTPWMRRNRNLRNRQFVSAVRTGLDGGGGDSSSDQQGVGGRGRGKKKKDQQEYIDEDMIEDALLQLQVLHSGQPGAVAEGKVLIHHTNAPVETAQWIAVFTQHISTVPYRRQREESNDASAAFCMETGQVRTGDDAADTYVKMLQEISRVTAPIAYGIANEFPTPTRLLAGFERPGGAGPTLLEGVRKSANKDGAVSDRTVGQAVSRRIYKIFTSRDENSTEI
ncbi:hypothetical protein QBC46DRAFT_454961 [Diplogelasinospora grovesii]|uniref:ERCC4 domain-containing protein n=1 Tax=Diplogelasinospora grovesii TaxID=303347 RepID=A0AAN6NI98_9PEZI|nr:hypothetical protein QBC46DRAFT_454961 [Diplogelasinospora grovesii]